MTTLSVLEVVSSMGPRDGASLSKKSPGLSNQVRVNEMGQGLNSSRCFQISVVRARRSIEEGRKDSFSRSPRRAMEPSGVEIGP